MADNKKDTFESFDFGSQPIRGVPELRWTGKRPFSSTQYFPAQRKEAYGDATDGWWNRLYWGDNLQVMSHLLREFRGGIDLIYIDPPFDSKADYKKSVEIKGASASSDHSSFEEKQYTDIWQSEQYLQHLYERLTLCRELLSDNGSIFLHCDSRKSHHLRLLCDEIFGSPRFLNEIVWKRRGGRTSTTGSGPSPLEAVSDTIFWYSKSSSYISNPIFSKEGAEEYIRKRFSQADDDGRKFRLSPLNSPTPRPNLFYEYKGYMPHKNGWSVSRSTMEEYDGKGMLYFPKDKGGRIQRKQYLDDWKGKSVQSVWTDIHPVNPQANERLGYPTQKPETLLERIVDLASNPGSIVFDGFMGSGTTQAVAMKKGRRFIGADINLGAIETVVKRLNLVRQKADDVPAELKLEDASTDTTKKFTGFELYNVNNYDIFRNPVEAKELIKEAMELQPLPMTSVFDGQRDQHLVKIMPVNRIATRADLNEVINGLDFKAYERRQAEAPSKIVDRIMLVCMGHEPDIGPELVKAAKPFNIEVEVVDLIRDKANLHFKRQSDAKLVIKDGHLEIGGFYPLNLLQKLSMETDAVEDWRQLVETIKVDWNYDGAVLSPELIDAPDKNELVTGRYPIPDDASTIRVKITDLLSESWEGEIEHG